MMLTIADAIEALTSTRPATSTEIMDAAVDSRQVIPGSLFVAMPGEHADGHDFLSEAFGRGAAFAQVQREVTPTFNKNEQRKTPRANKGDQQTPPL